MANHVIGKSTPLDVPPPCLDELRQQVLAVLLGHPLFTAAEQRRASHFVQECEDAARLTRWHANVLTEIAHHEVAAARRRIWQTLYAALRWLRPADFRGYRSRKPGPAPTWLPGAPLPDRADRRAGTFDRRAAAHFQPVRSLTFAHLPAPTQS